MKGPGATQRWLLTYLENVRYDEQQPFGSDLLPPGTPVEAPIEALFAAMPRQRSPRTSEEDEDFKFLFDTPATELPALETKHLIIDDPEAGRDFFWVPLGRAIPPATAMNPPAPRLRECAAPRAPFTRGD